MRDYDLIETIRYEINRRMQQGLIPMRIVINSSDYTILAGSIYATKDISGILYVYNLPLVKAGKLKTWRNPTFLQVE